MKRLYILLFILLGSSISCTVVDSELLELVLEIKNQNEKLLEEVKSLQAKSDSLINELKNSAAKQEEVLNKVTDLQVELAKALSQIGALNEQLSNQDADLEKIKLQLADLQEKYDQILIQLEQLQKLSQILAELEKLKGQLAELDGKYQVILGSLAENTEQLDALKEQVSILQAQMSENLTKISQLTSQLGEQGADIEKILAQIEELKANCAEIKILLEKLLTEKSPIPTNGLVGWWPFNGNAKDESGNGNDGLLTGAILVKNRNETPSSAYKFDGINDFIQTEFEGVLGNKERAISFWAKTDVDVATDGMSAISYGPNGLGTRFDAYFNFNKIGATSNIGGGAITYKAPKPINDNQWHHYVFMIDTPNATLGDIKVFQDGVLLNEVLSIFDSPNIPVKTEGGAPMVFGKTNYIGIPAFFKGELDEIAVFDRALTMEEISKIFKGEGF